MSTPLQKRAAAIRAKAKAIRASHGEVAEGFYLQQPATRATLEQAEAEASAARDSKQAERELTRAKRCGPELAHLIELRQRGRGLEADIYEQMQGYKLRDQRAEFERLSAEEPDESEHELSLMPELNIPEPPSAA